jgi:hypothetical protein
VTHTNGNPSSFDHTIYALGDRVICPMRPLPPAVIPEQARMHFANQRKGAAEELAPLRGNGWLSPHFK